jgi:hypothetical protein
MTSKRARSSTCSEAVAAEICRRLSEGESLRAICRNEAMPARQTVADWLTRDSAFFERYTRARLVGLDDMADELLEIADGAGGGEEGSAARASADVQQAKLRIDTRKWLLSKLAPQRYGDRIQHEHSGDVVVTTRIHLGGATRRD